jgi:hypothetical protein
MSAKRATTSLENPEQPAKKVVRNDYSPKTSDEDFEIFVQKFLRSSEFKPSAVSYDRKTEQKDVEDFFRSKKKQMTVPNYLHWVKTVQKVVFILRSTRTR